MKFIISKIEIKIPYYYKTKWNTILPIPKTLRKDIIRQIVEQYNKCNRCGKTAHEIHHIDRNKNNNSPKNLVPLCKKCHGKTRAGINSLKVVPKNAVFV